MLIEEGNEYLTSGMLLLLRSVLSGMIVSRSFYHLEIIYCYHQNSFFFYMIFITILSERGETYCIIFNVNYLRFLGYHTVDYWSIVPLDLDFNTSRNIFPTIFWFVSSSITCTPIIQIWPNTIWFVVCFTLSILPVVHCGSYRPRENVGRMPSGRLKSKFCHRWYQYYVFSVHIWLFLCINNTKY